MPLTEPHRPMTRAAAAAVATAMGAENGHPQHVAGKRSQEADSCKEASTKRSALGDISNRSRQPGARQQSSKAQVASSSGSLGDAAPSAVRNPFDHALESKRLAHVDEAATHHSRAQPQPAELDRYSSQSSLSAPAAPQHIDIDAISTLLGCPDYVVPIFDHFQQAERRRRPTASYIETVQTDISIAMRSILVDWLVEVAQEYRLVSDTLFLAISYIDRYLSLVPVMRSRLQLVGVTCLLVAAKYEEIYAPQVDQIVYITDRTYTREEVLSMEEHILFVLDFELTAPTMKTFLRRFIQAAMAESVPDARLEHLAAYHVELALVEYGSLQFLPSHIAAAAVLLAQYSLGTVVWSPTLGHYTGYSPPELQMPARMLHHLARVAYGQQPAPASREKFASARYKGVSQLRPPESLPGWLFSHMTA